MPNFDAEELKMILLRVLAIVAEGYKAISRSHLTTFIISRNPLAESLIIKPDILQRMLNQLRDEGAIRSEMHTGRNGIREDYFRILPDGYETVRWANKHREAVERIVSEAERAFRPHEREP